MIKITRDGGVFIGVEETDGGGVTNRRVVMPGWLVDGVWTPTDTTKEPAGVASLAAELWTPEAVASFKDALLGQIVEPSEADYSAHVNAVLSATALDRGYDSSASLASYATSKNAQWAAESQAFVDWRDAVWSAAFSLMASRPTLSAFDAALPKIQWPA